MNILVINAGSSSLKYQLMDPETGDRHRQGPVRAHRSRRPPDPQGPATGQEGGARTSPCPPIPRPLRPSWTSWSTRQTASSSPSTRSTPWATASCTAAISSSTPASSTRPASRPSGTASPWVPLHNPANLMGIEACEKVMPGKPQVAVFDTAFHMTMPPKAYRYAIPTEYYEEDHLRRYGFHGTSHSYVSKRGPSS